MRGANLVVLALLAGACGGPEPGSPWRDRAPHTLDLRLHLEAESLPLLGLLRGSLDLFVPKGLAVDFTPAVPAGFRGQITPTRPRPLLGGTWRHFELRLRPVRPGELKISPFVARAGEHGPSATTPQMKLQVRSLLEGAGPKAEAPAPPFPPGQKIWPWFAMAAALLLLVSLWIWWRRRKRPRIIETPLPAHVKALRALARLRKAPRSTVAQVDAFYVEVSSVLRVYLEERFGLKASKRTTEEFLRELRDSQILSHEQTEVTHAFLRQCDLVKFARALPDEEVHRDTFAIAERLVETTRPDRVMEGAA